MGKNLVIVESPAKAKTIEKFLGTDFIVKSSFGHICDLAKKGLGIDVDNKFEPQYEISDDKQAVVADLKRAADKADIVWLASDEDREGEAIAWHLFNVLELSPDKTKRIVFHEITKSAILHAIENPRSIDMNIVNAQQARRVLDRLVGFELSPVLWRKIKPALSAGRVQSVAVRLIAEREREIQQFIPEEYYRTVGEFTAQSGSVFTAELNDRLADAQSALEFLEQCKGAQFKVESVDKKPAKRSPAPPFTTSTLQQEASRRLGMPVSRVMSIAQKLYEAGLITYMRTDSLNLSTQAVAAIKQEIIKDFGEEYLHVRTYKTNSKGAQEAHEAIRPTYFENRNPQLTPQEKRLYDLIWKRAVASQMEDAKIERTVAKISISDCEKYMFQAEGEVITFDGFLKLQGETKDDDNTESSSSKLPRLTAGEILAVGDISSTQRFAASVSRFSEASLVKKLEDLGIGRPSTYVPTISTIVQRGYVVKNSIESKSRVITKLVLHNDTIKQGSVTEKYGAEKNKLLPTDIGLIVNDYLAENFVDILDYNFTAKVEKEFDEIADGTIIWNDMIDRFYDKFHVTVNAAMENKNRQTTTRQLGIDPKSGKMVYAKVGKFGPYVQLGENEDECGEKPQYANISNGQLVATITLEEAITLFQLPRTLGEFENKVVVIGVGRFGPYIRHDGKFVSLPKADNPYTVTLERAVELIKDKRVTDAQRHLKKFEESDNLEIMNGRWGAYIAYDGKNYKLPKDADIQALTYEECLKIVESQQSAEPKTKSVKAKVAAVKKTTTTRSRKKTADAK